MKVRGLLVVLTLSTALLTAACGSDSGGGAAPSTAAAGASRFDLAAAERYCTDEGGQLVTRQATLNTNGDRSQWLRLAGEATLCEFENTTDGNTTRISVDLVSLYSTDPTLAVLAYLSKVPPVRPPQVSANPAAYNCTTGLGGAESFGNGPAASGGWVDESQPTFVVMQLCVFADMSAIDEWGITYYADGTVRGADLATKFRYQPGKSLPSVFAAQ